jgi:hypothetical protein
VTADDVVGALEDRPEPRVTPLGEAVDDDPVCSLHGGPTQISVLVYESNEL